MGADGESHILILGLGNVLLRDEGLGVRALERLAAVHELPEQVQTLDGGTLGLTLLPFLEGKSHLLVLDAVQTGGPPGTLARLDYADLSPGLLLKMSAHQTGLQELLALGDLQGCLPRHIVVCGLQPEAIEWGVDLSPAVADRIDLLVDMALEELRRWGKTEIGDQRSEIRKNNKKLPLPSALWPLTSGF
jgi:hydrogenase maturation protease